MLGASACLCRFACILTFGPPCVCRSACADQAGIHSATATAATAAIMGVARTDVGMAETPGVIRRAVSNAGALVFVRDMTLP
jgi:hypothetical protein